MLTLARHHFKKKLDIKRQSLDARVGSVRFGDSFQGPPATASFLTYCLEWFQLRLTFSLIRRDLLFDGHERRRKEEIKKTQKRSIKVQRGGH